MELQQPWAASELANVTKKQLVEFLQKNGSNEFLQAHKLKGKLDNVVKASKKEALDAAYNDLFATKAFRTDQDEREASEAAAKRAEEQRAKEAAASSTTTTTSEGTGDAPQPSGPKGFKKRVLQRGDKTNFPKKGDSVKVRYKGMLEDGKVFDSNTGKRDRPLTFKVGEGKVIRGWDEALLEMSVGEKASITINPDWAYGAKGVEGKIPPNATLIFEVELEAIL